MRFHFLLGKVFILRDQNPSARPCKIADTTVVGLQQSRLPERGSRKPLFSKPPSQRRRQLRIHQEAHCLGCRQNGMIRVPGRISDRGSDILSFKIRKILQDLLLGSTSGKHLQNILNADSHPTDAGTSSALSRIDGDSLHADTSTPGQQLRQPRPRSAPPF